MMTGLFLALAAVAAALEQQQEDPGTAGTDAAPAAGGGRVDGEQSRPGYQLSHLEVLEAESIHIIREVVAEMERPCLLFSGGKDSIVMLRLAEKAFRPGRFPFPVMHVDTGHNFP